MSQTPRQTEHPGRAERLRTLLGDCRRRIGAGETLNVDGLIAAHASLMPELADELRKLQTGPVFTSSQPVPSRDDGDKRSPLPPDALPGYKIEAELSHGGQGVVYRATQLGTKQQVALKVLREGPFVGDATRRRFEREIELAASLRHPNIVTILDSGVSHGCFYFAMEYIDGLRLDAYLEQHKPSLRRTVELLAEICSAVNFAHQRGVIHRDVKPSNILVDAEGRPRVLDFGLAKPTQRVDSEQSTVRVLSTTGQLLGTLGYMSPEQAAGSQAVDVRSDVYALGVIAYEALLGQPPYPVMGPLGEVLSRIANDDPAPPRTLRAGSRFGREINDELATILLKALEKDPVRRYQSANDLGRDFQRFLGGEPIEAKRASGFYVFKKALRRYRVHATAAVLMFGLVVTFMIVLAVSYAKERQASIDAQQQRQIAINEAGNARDQRQIAINEAGNARDAEAHARLAEFQAVEQKNIALRMAAEAQRAVVSQKIQRGDLARAQGDLVDARDSYWDAFYDPYRDDESAAALWALRQYYAESGDAGACLLYVERFGPAALSSDGRLAAVCDAPRSVTVRNVDTGATLSWVAAPDSVTALRVDNNGRVFACGLGWARVWDVGTFRPLAAIELKGDLTPVSVHTTPDDAWAVVVGRLGDDATVLYTYSAETGAFRGRLALGKYVAGSTPPDISGSRIVIPTGDGVDLVTIDADGMPRSAHRWPTPQAARAAQFVTDDRIAVVSDTLAFANVDEAAFGPLEPAVALEREWTLLGTSPGSDAFVVGDPTGHVAVYEAARRTRAWRTSLEGLAEVRLRADGTVVTLDARGSATRWVQRSPWQQRPVHTEPTRDWTVSADGSTLLGVTLDDRAFAYNPGRSDKIEWLPRLPRSFVTGMDDELRIAVGGDGRRALMWRGDRAQIVDLSSGRGQRTRWLNRDVPLLQQAAFSGDGQVMAVFAASRASASGELQQIGFLSTAALGDAADTRMSLTRLCPLVTAPIELGGGAVRRIAFVPGQNRLLVARASGALQMLGYPDDPAARAALPAEPTPVTGDAWVTLDSPPVLLTFDRSGKLLAVSCEDGTIRLLSTTDGSHVGRISVGQPITAASFNSNGQVLAVRTSDEAVNLFEVESRSLISRWSLEALGDADGTDPLTRARRQAVMTIGRQFPQPMAWIGASDALLLGFGGAIQVQDYSLSDRLIAANRPYARQVEAAQRIQEGDVDSLDAGWAESYRLGDLNPDLAQNLQEAIVEAALRTPGAIVPPEYEHELAGAPARVQLRLGHAAYDSGRFDLARRWLARGLGLAGVDVDAYTLWRMAECDYLFGDFSAADELLQQLPSRVDFDARDILRAELERAAALRMSGRAAEGIQVARRIGQHPRSRLSEDRVTFGLPRGIGTYLFLGGGETLISTIESMLRLDERAMLYRDDLHFFAGELALHSRNLQEARAAFQRCIDTARDQWPSNWARFRLATLGDDASTTETTQ